MWNGVREVGGWEVVICERGGGERGKYPRIGRASESQ